MCASAFVLMGTTSADTGLPDIDGIRDGGMDFMSFFADPSLRGSGWARCPEPVTWSFDGGNLTAPAAQRETRRLRGVISQWSVASGVAFRFAGRQKMRFEPTTNQLLPLDDPVQPEHVYIAVKTSREVPQLSGKTVGLAMPSAVEVPQGRIINGMIVFSSAFVKSQATANPRSLDQLYLHELGHVMGLGHAARPDDVMYPTLTGETQLRPADIAAVQGFTLPCPP